MPRAVGVLPDELCSLIASTIFDSKNALYDEADICRDIASLMLVGNENFADIGRALGALLCPRATDPKYGERGGHLEAACNRVFRPARSQPRVPRPPQSIWGPAAPPRTSRWC